MITRLQIWSAQERAAQILQQAGIAITLEERQNIEVSEFGLGELEQTGLELVVYINTDRYCAKELILLSNQTCPEHRHPKVGGAPCKVETLRCRWGRVWLYVEGEPTPDLHGKSQAGMKHITPSSTRSFSIPASNTPFLPIPCIGFRRVIRVPSSPSSPPPATIKMMCSLTRTFDALRRKPEMKSPPLYGIKEFG
jgi:hypothetical protein